MGLLDWFGERDEPWRKLADQEIIEALNEDTGELIELRPTQRDSNSVEGLLIGFSYKDGSGSSSRRVVLCWRAFVTNGAVYVTGYCTFREALRTFRTDRMREARELRSSKSISNPAVYFEKYAEVDEDAFENLEVSISSRYMFDHDAWQQRYERRSRAKGLCNNGLKVLAYIALVDGFESSSEISVIKSYIIERLGPLGEDDELVEEMLSLSRGLAPSSRSFAASIAVIAEGERPHLELISRKAMELAKVDGEHNEHEAEALEKFIQVVRKKLRT